MYPSTFRQRAAAALPDRVRAGVRSLRRRIAGPPPTDPFHLLTSATAEELAIIDQCRPYTITTPARLLANMDAVEYIVRSDIPGALAECGVYRGGSVLSMILTLQRLGVTDRDVYLFDTFEGMTKPSEIDTSSYDRPALALWEEAAAESGKPWPEFFSSDIFNLDLVKRVMASTGYPSERIHFVVGMVEDTVPEQAPAELAVLRLDTDWYESTRYELEHLYPRLASGGVLIIDDYGHWDGARKAVDEHFATAAPPILLSRVDYSGRVGTKR